MPEPASRIIDTIPDAQGRQVTVGVHGGKVTLRTTGTQAGDPVELDGVMFDHLSRALVTACWHAMHARLAVSGHG
jgi:hypothetical protein